MSQEIGAIYENGLLRPLEPLHLPNHQLVNLTVELGGGDAGLDDEALQWARQEGDASIALDDVRRRLANLTGSLADQVIAERGDF